MVEDYVSYYVGLFLIIYMQMHTHQWQQATMQDPGLPSEAIHCQCLLRWNSNHKPPLQWWKCGVFDNSNNGYNVIQPKKATAKNVANYEKCINTSKAPRQWKLSFLSQHLESFLKGSCITLYYTLLRTEWTEWRTVVQRFNTVLHTNYTVTLPCQSFHW